MAEIIQDTRDEGDEELEMDDLIDLEDKEEDQEKIDENSLRKILEEGDIEDITDKLTPRALTKCNTNALLMAMEVSCTLRRLAKERGPDSEDFTKLANSVDEFTNCLLDPLKSNTEARNAFEDSLDYDSDVGIQLEQKTFLAHPVMYNLMNRKWWGSFDEIRRSSLFTKRWIWRFLNLWCLFDVVFPILFFFSKIKHRITRRNKEIDIAFVMNATSDPASEAFQLMKNIAKYVMKKKRKHQMKYQVVVHGEDLSSRDICFTDYSQSHSRPLSDRVDQLTRNVEVNIPALHEDLKKASEAFTPLIEGQRPHSEKVLVLLIDHKKCLSEDSGLVKEEIKKIKKMGIKIVPVGIGPNINIRELEEIHKDGSMVFHFGEYRDPEKAGKKLWHDIQGKDFFVRYLEYYRTPYFVFVRDTLSYLALLGLHFALCLKPSSTSFSWVEMAIFVFIASRSCLVYFQLKKFKQYEIYIGYDSGNGSIKSPRKEITFFKKFLSNRWNIMDLLIFKIYDLTFILRVSSLYGAATDNRVLAVAGYLYGINTMLLTLRMFGQVLETIKGIGDIQIALFQIIGDVMTIFWQFSVTILAFSLAITKVYMTERSFVSSEREPKFCKTNSCLACWWSVSKQLIWSLLGMAELDTLDSVDSASVAVAYLLFGAFLILAVILLVNMLIALLSNTYQHVKDNSLKEWSFKKAITIQAYSTYDPIPAPFNMIFRPFLLFRWLDRVHRHIRWQKLFQPWLLKGYNKSLENVVKNLQHIYLAKYGCSFPLTDERKMNHVLQEIYRDRQIANQIAHAKFAAHDCVLPTGPKAWQSQGISVQGCLLTCEDIPAEYHGARYIFPFSPETPHLEVLIQETGGPRMIGVGVVGEDYGNHSMPGRCDGTVGYHVHDGRIFDAKEPTNGREYEDAMAYRGDLIGCTVKFDKAKEGKVPIVFSLNGRQITQDEILMDYIPNEKSLYPYIAIGHVGIRVLAMLRPKEKIVEHP